MSETINEMLITQTESAEILGVSEAMVRYLKLPPVVERRGVKLYFRSDIEELAEQRKSIKRNKVGWPKGKKRK